MKKTVFILFFTVAFASFNQALAAGMPPPPPGGGMTPPCWPPPCVPVDKGVVFLMLAGAIYAAKKYYDYKKNKSLTH